MADKRAVALDRYITLFISSNPESRPIALVDSMLRNRLLFIVYNVDNIVRLTLYWRGNHSKEWSKSY